MEVTTKSHDTHELSERFFVEYSFEWQRARSLSIREKKWRRRRRRYGLLVHGWLQVADVHRWKIGGGAE